MCDGCGCVLERAVRGKGRMSGISVNPDMFLVLLLLPRMGEEGRCGEIDGGWNIGKAMSK